MTSSEEDAGPFGVEPIEHIPLAGAPLVKVVCQVKWPPSTAMRASLEEVLRHIGKSLADEFPVTRAQHEFNLVVGPEGVSQQAGGKITQFVSIDESWVLVVSESFIALETTSYVSQDDFCLRLKGALAALAEVVNIPPVARIGYRYINRVAGSDKVAGIDKIIKEPVRGGRAVPLVDDAVMIHTLSETVYQVRSDRLLARWAVLPPGATVDPSIKPIDEPSWILDLDSYREGQIDPHAETVVDIARSLSELGYKFFRWAVDEDFLKQFGGKL